MLTDEQEATYNAVLADLRGPNAQSALLSALLKERTELREYADASRAFDTARQEQASRGFIDLRVLEPYADRLDKAYAALNAFEASDEFRSIAISSDAIGESPPKSVPTSNKDD